MLLSMHNKEFFFFNVFRVCVKKQNAIKVAHRYAVQVSDTTMLPKAASLPGQ